MACHCLTGRGQLGLAAAEMEAAAPDWEAVAVLGDAVQLGDKVPPGVAKSPCAAEKNLLNNPRVAAAAQPPPLVSDPFPDRVL